MRLQHRLSKRLESIDTPDISDEEFVQSYRFRDRILRTVGVYRSVNAFLSKASAHWASHRSVTFLELYCGLGGLSRHILRWGEERGFDFHVLAVDRYGRIIDLAKENGEKDARLIYDVRDWNHSTFLQAQQFDYVFSLLSLHRLPESECVPFIKRANLLAKNGLFLMDWMRTRQAWIAMKAASQFSLERLIRQDGPVSIARSYDRKELEQLIKEAGVDYLEFRTRLGVAAILCGERGLVMSPALGRVTGLAT